MTKSWNISSKAREVLATPSHEKLEILVDQLFSKPKDTDEYKAAKALYDFCANTFQNCLTRKLLMVHRDSSDDVFRLRSIRLLSELREHGIIELSPVALNDIKPLVVSCLTKQQHKRSQASILGTVVSLVACNVMTSKDGRSWDELSHCILSLASTEPLKAFHVFLGLPPIKNWEFINRFMLRILMEAEKVFADHEPDKEDWRIALETVVKIGIQVLNSENRYYSMQSIISILVKSVAKVDQEKGMEQLLQRRLEGLEKFLSRDNTLYNYNEDQRRFVSELAAELTKRSFRFSPCFSQEEEINSCGRGRRSGRAKYAYLKTLSSLQILEMVVSNKLRAFEEELAVRHLNVLLSDHTKGKSKIDIAVIRKLQPLLISCVGKREITEKTLMILGQVVKHVAKEIFNKQEDSWVDLRDFITSHCRKTEFTRGCYIFRCLTMPLDDQGFVIPVMEKLLPEIRRMLNPPGKLLVDNFCWAMAFTGAFCAIIHMVEIETHARSVEEIEEKMIESVTHLVEQGMETGLVMRAFKDMEIIIKEEMKWYTANEFTLVKRLLWRLLAVEGMSVDSKLFLDGISVMVENKSGML